MKKTYVMSNGKLLLKGSHGELIEESAQKYGFIFSNGLMKYLTEDDAKKYCEDNNCIIEESELIENIKSQALIRCNSHSMGDSWKPGFHPGLGKVVTSYRDYQNELKEKNLIEIGNETPIKDGNKKIKTIDESIIRDAIQMGAEISGVEADALINGTYENAAVDEAIKESVKMDASLSNN